MANCTQCGTFMMKTDKSCDVCGHEVGSVVKQRCVFQDSGRLCPYVADHHSTRGYCYYHARHDHEWGARLLDDIAYNGIPKHYADKEIEARLPQHKRREGESREAYESRIWQSVVSMVSTFNPEPEAKPEMTASHNADEETSRRILTEGGYL